jgi:FkbM family methyltransferase
MPTLVQSLVSDTLKKFDIGVMSYSRLQLLEDHDRAYCRSENDIPILMTLPERHTVQLLNAMRESKSQLRQDLFVLSELEFKRGGYFVEFGATDGVDLSNSHLLEKSYGWSGIVAEPARTWHNALRANRSCYIESKCVWRDSNSELVFHEAKEGEFSTIDTFSESDLHKNRRLNRRTYRVETISLLDLLDKYNAPKVIDYLSIDTEGSEYEILSHFDFDKYRFRVITCEHNCTPQREKIHSLLASHGYRRKFEELSRYDDWYVLDATQEIET